MYRRSFRLTHLPTGLVVVLPATHHRSFHKRRLLGRRLMRSKVAVLARGGYRVVDGELVPEAPAIELATTVETGTIREEEE